MGRGQADNLLYDRPSKVNPSGSRAKARAQSESDAEAAKETLIVDRFSSSCGNCGRGAKPSELKHTSVLGYGVGEGEVGCGQVWKYVTSSYPDLEDNCKEMRPDLTYRPHIY